MKQLLYFISILVFFTCVSFWSFNEIGYEWNWAGVLDYRKKFSDGFITTIWISVSALLLSIIIALMNSFLLGSRHLFLRTLGKFYVELVRGTPLLVQLLLIFYVFAQSFGISNRYLVGIFSLALFSGAYISEIFRAGLESIPKAQWDAARVMGLSEKKILSIIIIPQAFRVILPPLAGQFISLIKDSSLLSVIAISELTLNAQEVNSFTYSTLESYIPLAFLYLLLTLPLSQIIKFLEKKMKYET
jgi:polar amino acid transport system permease protein